MSDATSAIDRIARLERRVRTLSVVTAGSLIALLATVTIAWTTPPQSSVLRARRLVLEDEQGRDRIVLGAPLPSLIQGGVRLPSRVGMTINDSTGLERFGLSLASTGSLGMGFDAPAGTGDDRNRERINIVADGEGGSYIRFLNRQTSAAGFLRLGDDDRMWLEFLDVQPSSIVQRRIGFNGDERVEIPR
ncbi:MAG: hypothetical protein PVH96_10705 [Gemmatimonadota bacterium]|jgi:hypothetical protein